MSEGHSDDDGFGQGFLGRVTKYWQALIGLVFFLAFLYGQLPPLNDSDKRELNQKELFVLYGIHRNRSIEIEELLNLETTEASDFKLVVEKWKSLTKILHFLRVENLISTDNGLILTITPDGEKRIREIPEYQAEEFNKRLRELKLIEGDDDGRSQ